MTLQELSVEYRTQADTLANRIQQLQALLVQAADPHESARLQARIQMLSVMRREAVELAVLTERYYDRGYHKNVWYTI